MIRTVLDRIVMLALLIGLCSATTSDSKVPIYIQIFASLYIAITAICDIIKANK